MFGMRFLVTDPQIPSLLGPGALIEERGDGGRRAFQRFRFDPREITLVLIDFVVPTQCTQAANLGLEQGDLVRGIESRLNPAHMNAAFQDGGSLGVAIERLQIKPQSQQLLGQPGCKGAGTLLHRCDVATINPERIWLGG
jgi:hypothetical protein